MACLERFVNALKIIIVATWKITYSLYITICYSLVLSEKPQDRNRLNLRSVRVG